MKTKKKKLKFVPRNVITGAFGNGPLEICTGVVERIINEPGRAGIFTKFVGCSYLFKGYPDVRTLRDLRVPKGLLKVYLSIFRNRAFQLFLGIVFVISRGQFKKIILFFCQAFIRITYDFFRERILLPQKFCCSVREIYRTSVFVISEIKDTTLQPLLIRIKDIICMFLEYDLAYRFRLQDILLEIDKKAFKESPIREIRRLFQIMKQREESKYLGARWKMFERTLVLAIRISPEVKRLVIKFACELDLEKIKLDEADWYFCLNRSDYDFNGISHEERSKEEKRIDRARKHNKPKLTFKKQ